MSGYFEIGVVGSKFEQNIGTLWRSAFQLGASGIFTIGARAIHSFADTCKSWRSIPLRNYNTWEIFWDTLPRECAIIGVEMGGEPLRKFKHPKRCIYLLGAEDYGLPNEIGSRCQSVVEIESLRFGAYNVAVAGTLVMYSRALNLEFV